MVGMLSLKDIVVGISTSFGVVGGLPSATVRGDIKGEIVGAGRGISISPIKAEEITLLPGDDYNVRRPIIGHVTGFSERDISKRRLYVEVSIKTDTWYPQGTAKVEPNGNWVLESARFGGVDHIVKVTLKDKDGKTYDNATTHIVVVVRREEDMGRETMSVPKKLAQYGIAIVTPVAYAQTGNSFAVSGTYKALPESQHIWISTFNMDLDGNIAEYWPQSEAKATNGKWYGQVYNVGGAKGETREFLVFVVGSEGRALFNYYVRTGTTTNNWTSIRNLTSDVVLCGRGVVII
jgi:hypothetical protein